MKSKLFVSVAMLMTALAFSQSSSINYKALIKDNLGNVVANDLIVVQFQILQGVGMTNVYQETHTPNTDANGFVILNIGEGSVNSGDYSAIDWGSDDHYLNVQINTGGGLTDMGTTQFLAVPYAKYAETATVKINDLADGKSDNDGSEDGSSLFLGIDAGLNDNGTDNRTVGIGYEVLKNSTTGNFNTAIGYQVLVNNSTGYSNTASGYKALNSNIDGFDNVAIGFSALRNNISGLRNAAIGFGSLNNNQLGNENSAIGVQAGFNSLGNLNVFIGNKSGFNETGNNKLYVENSDADTNNALIYGEFGADNTTSDNILRTNSEFQIGNPAVTGYAFPMVDGTANQVLQTDGTGSISWINSINSINDLTDGKSDNDGSEDGSSLFLGVDAGLNDDGTNNRNVGIGYQVLYSNTTGNYNTANGSQALYSNSEGGSNVANGYQSLFSNITGINNTAIGYQALNLNTASSNTAVGFTALYSNTTIGRLTAIGYRSLYNNTAGEFNTATGYESLFTNTTGSNNTANGYQALLFNTLGSNNTANGYRALFNNIDGSYNTANGYRALFNNTTGISNTANGFHALYYNTTGSHNIANGEAALYNNTTGRYNTANGYLALYSNTEGSDNTANGTDALRQNTTGNSNTAIGPFALYYNTTGDNNTAIGKNAQVPDGTLDNQVRIGDTFVSYAGVQVAWDVTSDQRWKEQIRDVPYGLDMIKQLRPVDYIRKNNEHKTREMGFIAQDVEALLAKIGYDDQGFLHKDDKGFMSLRYNDFIALLTKAIQEQQEIIEKQATEIRTLKEEQSNGYEKLLKRIEQLELVVQQ